MFSFIFNLFNFSIILITDLLYLYIDCLSWDMIFRLLYVKKFL